ncbi:MAG: cell division ATPase MinD [Candidatus Aenigmatarchaeota archaeon]
MIGLRKIGIISGKGGVGKTTLVANLGLALREFDRNVAIVDCNLTTAHLGFHFGFFYFPKTINNVLRGEAKIEEAICYHPSGLKIIPASLSLDDIVEVNISTLKYFLNELKDVEILLLDSAPGFGREAISVLNASDEVIFITNPNISAVSDIERAYTIVKELDLIPLGIVLNMVKNEPYELSAKDVEELTGIPVIATIPYDKNIEKSLMLGKPIVGISKYSPSAIAFRKLAAEILGERYSPPKARIFSRIYEYFKLHFS